MVFKYIYSNKNIMKLKHKMFKQKAIFRSKHYSKMKTSYAHIKILYFHQEKTDPLQFKPTLHLGEHREFSSWGFPCFYQVKVPLAHH